MLKRIISFSLLLLFFQNGFCIDPEKITDPTIINYDRTDYNASTQNWAIAQGADNIMWFANIGEILWFNGSEWGSVAIPNSSIVRSVSWISDNTILAGAFAEFGSIEKDIYGDYYYSSWLDKIPEKYRNLTDIWKIYELNNTVYLQTFEYILMFRNNAFIGAFETPTQFRFSFISNGRLYIEEIGTGLKVLIDNDLTTLEKGEFFQDKVICSVGHASGRLTIGTMQNGIFIFRNGTWEEWDTELNRQLKEHILFCGLQMEKNLYIFGTVKNGAIITNEKGEIQKVLNKKNGLQNNTVLSVFRDNEKNIWLGLDKGIDYIKVNFQFSRIKSEEGLGTGYASISYNDQLYLGTNQGVYSWSDGANEFQIIENSAGQVWSFEIINDRLYCCHHNGIYRIDEDGAKLIFNNAGTWKLLKVPGKDNTYVAGCYTGLYAIDFGKSIRQWPLEGFNESCRIFEFDEDGSIWMSHGYKGIYRIKTNDEFTFVESVSFFGENQGLPSNTNNEVFKYGEHIIVAAKDGFYSYNDIIGLMQPFTSWNEMLRVEHPVTKVYTDPWGRISIFNGGKITWALINEDTLTYIDEYSFLPLKNIIFHAFENIYFLSHDIALIGTTEGFCLYNRNLQFSQNSTVPLEVSHLYSIVGRNGLPKRINHAYGSRNLRLPYQQNNLFIDLSAPLFQNKEFLEIRYRINNSPESTKVLNNQVVLQDLEDKKYIIEIIAEDLARKTFSEPLVVEVIILPPWFRRWFAYIAYSVLLIALILTAVLILRKYFERLKRREQLFQRKKMMQQQMKLQEQAEAAEKQIIIMKNEKLELENRIKAEEIANSTMELVYKNKMLINVKENLKIIQKENSIEVRNNAIKSILRQIDRDLNNEEKWIVFEKNFDEVHENFLNRLKESHPALTAKDLRLCAYLRMNLSSKEIAPLLRISIRSVEISRYRLRKKLGLQRDHNLSDYILLF